MILIKKSDTSTYPILSNWRWVFIALLWGLGFISTLAADPTCSTPSFLVKPDNIVGAYPVFVAVADLNGDGKADLVTANSSSDNISMFLGNGDGTFRPGVNYRVGSSPVSVATGDFNGDGKLDLVVANGQSTNVSILLGNGDGSFRTPANYTVASGPVFVTVSDLNGDGKPDFVVANQFPQGLSTFLGNGDGTFRSLSNTPLTALPLSVVVTDFNGDGTADLAVEEFNPEGGLLPYSLSILVGNGDGTFSREVSTSLSFGSGSTSFFPAGDFNRDGKMDLALAGPNGTVSILMGNGDGTFQNAVNYNTGTLVSPRGVAMGDFNGDGNLDLVTGPVRVSILLGNGDGTFRAPLTLDLPDTTTFVAVGDFTGRGKRDLVAANSFPGSVSVLLGKGDGAFQNPVNYSTGAGPGEFALTDFNRDGRTDLAVSNYSLNTVSVLLGNGDGSFRTPVEYSVGSGPIFVLTGDFNRDGKLDLAVANSQSSDISILLGNGDGTFRPAVSFPAGSNPYGVVVSDFNGDGKPDLAVVNPSQVVHDFFSQRGDVAILLGNGDGTFQSPVHYLAGTNPGRAITTGDFDGDGKVDLAVIDQGNNLVGIGDVAILLGNGDGTFQNDTTFAAGFTPGSIAAGDFNGDGILDLAVGRSFENPDGSIAILLGNGDGTFKTPASFGDHTRASFLVVGDFNGDGKLDLASGNTYPLSSSISILLGNGDGTFHPPVNYSVDSPYLRVGDIDGDGKLDVVTSNTILFNTCPAGNAELALFLAQAGAQSTSTTGGAGFVQAGFATVNVDSGGPLYGTAVFSLQQNGTVVSEAGVPASPPTTAARIFVDYRLNVPSKSGLAAGANVSVNTGFAVANTSDAVAQVSYTLRNLGGQILGVGHGSVTAGAHLAKFIDQLQDVAVGFQLPPDFATATQFGSLEIHSDQPVSVVALRLTTNQRGETLITTTPIADLTATTAGTQLFFPHMVDGGGYETRVALMNTSGVNETGNLQIFADNGTPLAVRPVNGSSESSFSYSIPPSGIFVFQTDGSPSTVNAGWIQVTADSSGPLPVGAGIFGFRQGGILVTESGIPSVFPTNHAMIYVDKSNGHDTGLAIAAPGGGGVS